MFEVEFFRLEDGTKPAGQFIKSIEDVKLRAKVIRSVKLLETFGNKLTEPEEIELAKSRIENGNCIPTLATLNALAKALGKNLKITMV